MAVALAAGLTTFAQMGAAQAEAPGFFDKAQVDPTTTGSVGDAATKPVETARAKPVGANSPHRPALIAVERSSSKKYASLPGVKEIKLDESVGEDGGKSVASVKSSGGRKYSTIVSRYASAYGVPVNLAHAVIRVESNYRADARGSAGEVGLMQIKPATARMLGYTGSTKALYDPDTNIKWGMKYLAKAHDLGGGSTCGTILKYNAGHGAKRMNPISAAYCAKVKRVLAGA